MAIRKTRTDAWGEDLPPETRRELYEGFASKDFEREVLPHLSLQGYNRSRIDAILKNTCAGVVIWHCGEYGFWKDFYRKRFS